MALLRIILGMIILTIAAILGIIYFYKTIDSTSALIYGIYATTILILSLFALISLEQFWLIPY